MSSPPLDPAARDQPAIMADLVRRLHGYTPELSSGVNGRAATALLQVFARYQELLGGGLAQVPGRSFLAFLEMLGIELLPAQAASAPLVFSLTDGSPVDVTLPAGSQVAATPAPAAPSLDSAGTRVQPAPPPEPAVFATEQSITLCRSKLLAMYSIDPGRDALADHSAHLTRGFALFEELEPCEHAVYLGHDHLLAEVDGMLLILPFANIKYIAAYPALPNLTEHTIKGASVAGATL